MLSPHSPVGVNFHTIFKGIFIQIFIFIFIFIYFIFLFLFFSDFYSGFSWTIFPRALHDTMRAISNFAKIQENIRSSRYICTRGVIDTSGNDKNV